MSDNEHFEPTGYQEDDTPSQNVESTSSETVVKPKSKLPLVVFGGIFVVAALGITYFLFAPQPSPSNQGPSPAAQQLAQQEAQNAANEGGASAEGVDPTATDADPLAGMGGQDEDPFAQMNNATQDPASGMNGAGMGGVNIDPLTGLPVASVDPNNQQNLNQPTSIDPLTGLPVAGNQAVQNQGQVQGQPVQVFDPLTGLPVDQSAQQPVQQPVQQDITQAPVQTTQINPETGLPFGMQPQEAQQQVAQEQITQEQVMVDDGQNEEFVVEDVVDNGDIEITTEVVEIEQSPSDDVLAQFRDVLAPIDGRVTKLEKEVSTVKKQISSVTSRVSKLERNQSSAPKKAAPKDTSREKKTKVQPPVSRIIIQEGRPYSEVRSQPDIVIRQQPVVEQAQERVVQRAPSTCNIQAIVQGRAWIKQQDGSFVTYGVGDTWINGGRIEAINPDNGISVDGQWHCM